MLASRQLITGDIHLKRDKGKVWRVVPMHPRAGYSPGRRTAGAGSQRLGFLVRVGELCGARTGVSHRSSAPPPAPAFALQLGPGTSSLPKPNVNLPFWHSSRATDIYSSYFLPLSIDHQRTSRHRANLPGHFVSPPHSLLHRPRSSADRAADPCHRHFSEDLDQRVLTATPPAPQAPGPGKPKQAQLVAYSIRLIRHRLAPSISSSGSAGVTFCSTPFPVSHQVTAAQPLPATNDTRQTRPASHRLASHRLASHLRPFARDHPRALPNFYFYPAIQVIGHSAPIGASPPHACSSSAGSSSGGMH